MAAASEVPFKESKDETLYEILIKNTLGRILDLDRACQSQGIEPQYLHPYDNEDGRNSEIEAKLLQLYGKWIQEKRIHGVKYTSRQSPSDTCYVCYDTFPDLNEYFQMIRGRE